MDGTPLDLLLTNGERRRIFLPSRSGEIASALDRLDTWIRTADGGWVQKQHVVEARAVGDEEPGAGSTGELAALDAATDRLLTGS